MGVGGRWGGGGIPVEILRGERCDSLGLGWGLGLLKVERWKNYSSLNLYCMALWVALTIEV